MLPKKGWTTRVEVAIPPNWGGEFVLKGNDGAPVFTAKLCESCFLVDELKGRRIEVDISVHVR